MLNKTVILLCLISLQVGANEFTKCEDIEIDPMGVAFGKDGSLFTGTIECQKGTILIRSPYLQGYKQGEESHIYHGKKQVGFKFRKGVAYERCSTYHGETFCEEIECATSNCNKP